MKILLWAPILGLILASTALAQKDQNDDQNLFNQLATLKGDTQSGNITTCDKKQAYLKEQVTYGITQHFNGDYKSLTDAFEKKYKKNYRVVTLGPLKMVTSLKKKHTKPDVFKFEKETYKWATARRHLKWFYFWNRNWPSTYELSSSLLREDEDRLVFGSSISLEPKEIPLFKRMYEEILSCYNKSACEKINFSKDSLEVIKNNSELLEVYKTYPQHPYPESIAYMKTSFEKVVDEDIFPWPSTAVSTEPGDSRNTLLVKMDAGDLRGYESTLEKIMDRWSVYGLKIKIVWSHKESNPDSVYKIFVDLKSGDRSYVDPDKREIHFSPIEGFNDMTHEMGHVLGLPDDYYSYFNEKTCAYRYLSNGADIMSDPATGHILPSHIHTLKVLYFSNYDPEAPLP